METTKEGSAKYRIAEENNKIVLHSEINTGKKKAGRIKKTFELLDNKFSEVK